MDAMIIRARVNVRSLAVAVAAILASTSTLVGAATASETAKDQPRASAGKAGTAPAGHTASVGARVRASGRLASGPRAASEPATPPLLGPRKPLELTLSPSELTMILGRYPAEPGDGAHSAFDDVTVLASAELQPMRDPAHEVWGGIAAPAWALLHPTQAWRIFLPIPPR